MKDFLIAGGQFVASVSFLDGQFGLSKNILGDILESEKVDTVFNKLKGKSVRNPIPVSIKKRKNSSLEKKEYF